jgi:hypothetical protein
VWRGGAVDRAFFRRWRAVPLIGLPAVLGTVLAFAVAAARLRLRQLVDRLPGLHHPRQRDQLRHHPHVRATRSSARPATRREERSSARVAGVVRGTGGAAICASAAYASLMLTSFRGFYQFGVMGAVGVLFCWLCTFTVLPASSTSSIATPAGARPGARPLSLSGLGRLLTRAPPRCWGPPPC